MANHLGDLGELGDFSFERSMLLELVFLFAALEHFSVGSLSG